MSKLKICAGCRYYSPPKVPVYHYRDGICGHAKSFIKTDIITGRHEYHTCVYMREGAGACTKEGLLYEERPRGLHEQDNG